MITTAQATEYLAEACGVTVPSFIVSAAVERVEAAEPAMEAAGYDEATMTLVQSMAVAIVASPASRQLKSQHAPSGASRSFDYDKNLWSNLRRTLAALDTAGTVTDIVGPDPAGGTLFMVTC